MPKTDQRKLIQHIQNELIENNIKMGELLCSLLRSMVLPSENQTFHITTDSKHFFYKSLTYSRFDFKSRNKSFNSDITYIKLH
jgi:hypothetical protein